MTDEAIPKRVLERLCRIRREVRADGFDARAIAGWEAELSSYRSILRPGDGEERLGVVAGGEATSELTAPRWLCHALGLRHRCAHVMLRWSGAIDFYVLQVRAPSKSDSPLHLDVSAAGHVVSPATEDATARDELLDELGVAPPDLVIGLQRVLEYETRQERLQEHFVNSECCTVYEGRLRSLEALSFDDGEVAAVQLWPVGSLEPLCSQRALPVAAALREFVARRGLHSPPGEAVSGQPDAS